jgi:hypothetical protein
MERARCDDVAARTGAKGVRLLGFAFGDEMQGG